MQPSGGKFWASVRRGYIFSFFGVNEGCVFGTGQGGVGGLV